jgi:hypothetical protein
MRSSSPSKGELKMGTHEAPCSGEVVGAANGVESGTGEGVTPCVLANIITIIKGLIMLYMS